MVRWLSAALLIAAVVLTGCSGRGELAPVRDQASRPAQQPDQHVVRKGETLYSIAWLYGLDYKTLAANNGINSGYRIYVGQKLRLKGSPKRASSQKPRPPVKRTITAKAKPAAKPKPVTRPKVIPKPQATTKSSSQTHSTKPSSSSSFNSHRKVSWAWPSKGRVRTSYSSRRVGKKGMTIAGKLKSSVYAAAAGKVVYSGNGLTGYGNLIIIKHSKSYLSAYGFNHRLLVKEGAVVKRGQRIAEMGRDGKAPPGLYFEIRSNGKPVNPQALLPRKR